MRITITLDPDVAVVLKRVCAAQYASRKQVVNEALRRGLTQMESPPSHRAFATRRASLGRCLVGGIDDVSEVLALGEGEDYR